MAKTKENLDDLYLDAATRQQMKDYVSSARAKGDSWADIHNYVDNTYRIPKGYYTNADGSEFYTLSDQDKNMLSEGAQRQAMSAVSNSLARNGNTTGAHSTVEQIRKQDAAFSGGIDGSQYITQPGQYSMPNVGNMSSRYQYTDPTSITDTVMQHYQDVPSIYDLYSYQDTPDYYADVDLNIPKVADGNYKDVHFDTSKIKDVGFDSSGINTDLHFDPSNINTNVGFNRDGINTNLAFDRSGIGQTTYNPDGIDTNVQFNPNGINMNVGNVSDRFQYEKAPEIVDNYADVINSAADKVANRAAFEYNPDNDPLFAVYQKQYAREGDRAAANALANAAMLSGGQASTAAIAASQQAQNYYGSQMADKIPELYQIAYNQYQDEGENLRRNVDMYRSLRSDDYGLQESNRNQHNFDQQFLYNMALQDLAQENANNQMAFNIADTQRQQANINNNMLKAIADTDLSNQQFNEQMNYNMALQDLGAQQWNQDMLYNMALQDMNADQFNSQMNYNIAAQNADMDKWNNQMAFDIAMQNMNADEYNNTMQFNIADTNRQQGNIDNQLQYNIANADAANALQRASLQTNIAGGRSSNFQNDRSTQIGMAENEQGRITDANNWWRNLALDDESQRQFNEKMKYDIAAADIAQENTNREAKYNVWNDNFNRSLDAADLMAAAGDFSRYGAAYGLTPEETALLKAAYDASLTQGSGGGSSGGGSSRGRSGSKRGSSGSNSTPAASNNQVILGNPASGRVTTAQLPDGYSTDYWQNKGYSTTFASIMNQKDAGLLSQANSTYKNAVKNGKLTEAEKKKADAALNKAYKEKGRTRKK